MSKVAKALGAKIKQIRKEKDLSQMEVAERANLNLTYYNQVENGKRNPSLKTIEKIARAFKVKVDDLL